MKAQQEPVWINKNGKPAAYVVSANEFEEFQAYRLAHLQKKLEEGLADVKAGRVVNGAEFVAKMSELHFDGGV